MGALALAFVSIGATRDAAALDQIKYNSKFQHNRFVHGTRALHTDIYTLRFCAIQSHLTLQIGQLNCLRFGCNRIAFKPIYPINSIIINTVVFPVKNY